MQSIPVVDVSEFLAGAPGAAKQLGAEVREAFENVGFMVMVGHDIEAERIADIFAQAARFHAQPLAAKQALAMNEHNNGYMAKARYAVWTSEINANDQPDLNEAFFIKRERDEDDPQVRPGRRFTGPNQWPLNLPGFKQSVLDYASLMDRLSLRLLPAIALALDLPENYFDQRFECSQYSLRLSHYPPERARANQFGIAPHTDMNFLTFLPQSEVPGLQVRMPDGRWLDVPPIEGSFAVNVGDTLHCWSNRRFMSTPHRALPPVAQHRYAAPFFLGPNIDTVIDCLPSCHDQKHPAQFEPIKYEDWMLRWYDANYDYRLQEESS